MGPQERRAASAFKRLVAQICVEQAKLADQLAVIVSQLNRKAVEVEEQRYRLPTVVLDKRQARDLRARSHEALVER